MDGPWYNEGMPPFQASTAPQVTMTSSNQPLFPNSWLQPNRPGFFDYVGKTIYYKAWGVSTTGATPGNFNLFVYWGNNTASNGTQLGSNAFTWVASLTNVCWSIDLYIRARAIGVNGQLVIYGTLFLGQTGLWMFPFSGTITGVVCDLSRANSNFISPQVNRSGTTAETITPWDMYWQQLN
jgi:hypothetical protein